MRSLKLSVLCLPLLVSFVGCGEEAKVQEKTKVSGPDGTSTITKETKVENTGKNPPVPIAK